MMQWLRRTTPFQRVSLALLILALGSSIVSYLSAGSLSFGLVLLALILCYIAFRRNLLWRVRNRLLVSYFLLGFVPLILGGFLLILTAELLLGQFATQRVREGLQTQIAGVRSTAQVLMLAASHGAKPDLLDAIRQRVPGLAALIRTGADTFRLPPEGSFQTTPDWIAPGFADLFEAGGRYYIGANAQSGKTDAFAYLPLDTQALASLTSGAVSVAALISGDDRTDIVFGPSGSRITAFSKGVRNDTASARLAPPRSWWDVPTSGMLVWNAKTSSGTAEILLILVSRPSLLIAGVVTGRMATIALSVLVAIIIFFFLVEGFALFSSSRLTRAITRSVDQLYRGTLQVARGDFSHQIPIEGHQQLSDLAASFNGMTAKIQHLLGEMKKKEKLDAELEIARQVQLRLFPKSVPQLHTLEMAGVCMPARIVSGDYYDYVRLADRWTAIALGDVSGKGVSAALLMASIQSALHAQLKFTAASSHPDLSIAKLMELISQQLYESTPPEKYATFFCSLYDDQTGRLTYVNAGHLKPILVHDGQATTLEGGGMVVGLLPNVTYEQQDFLLRPGDLLAVFSDGIPEAQNAAEQEFGEDHLAEVLVAQSNKPLGDIIQVVTSTVEKWIHDHEGRDDLTLLLLRKL